MDADRRECERLTVLLLQERLLRRRADLLVSQLREALSEAETLVELLEGRLRYAQDPRNAA